MPRKPKKKLTPEQRRARKRRRQETMIVFINGKQKRVPRPRADDDDFLRHADPITLHQLKRWDLLELDASSSSLPNSALRKVENDDDDFDLPF